MRALDFDWSGSAPPLAVQLTDKGFAKPEAEDLNLAWYIAKLLEAGTVTREEAQAARNRLIKKLTKQPVK